MKSVGSWTNFKTCHRQRGWLSLKVTFHNEHKLFSFKGMVSHLLFSLWLHMVFLRTLCSVAVKCGKATFNLTNKEKLSKHNRSRSNADYVFPLDSCVPFEYIYFPSICVEGRGWSFEGNFIWQTVLKQLVCFKNLCFAFVNHLVWFSPSNAPSRPSEAFEGQLCSFEGVSMRTRCWQLLKVCKYYVVQHRLVSPVRRHAA